MFVYVLLLSVVSILEFIVSFGGVAWLLTQQCSVSGCITSMS